MPAPLAPEVVAAVVDAYARHGSVRKAAAEAGCSGVAAWRYLRRLGLFHGRREVPTVAVLEAYARLGSYAATARELGVSRPTVAAYVQRAQG